jgi:hypothetical protein
LINKYFSFTSEKILFKPKFKIIKKNFGIMPLFFEPKVENGKKFKFGPSLVSAGRAHAQCSVLDQILVLVLSSRPKSGAQ